MNWPVISLTDDGSLNIGVLIEIGLLKVSRLIEIPNECGVELRNYQLQP